MIIGNTVKNIATDLTFEAICVLPASAAAASPVAVAPEIKFLKKRVTGNNVQSFKNINAWNHEFQYATA